jgi:hypothetical protein
MKQSRPLVLIAIMSSALLFVAGCYAAVVNDPGDRFQQARVPYITDGELDGSEHPAVVGCSWTTSDSM